jgi:hypothetical protein
MKLAESEFDVFITVDRNLAFQQNLPKFEIAVIVLRAASNRYQDLAPFAKAVLDSLQTLRPGSIIVL